MDTAEMERHARDATRLLKALGNERRLMILCNLAEGEKSVGELQQLVGLSQSALSQHLARLRRDGLVETRREAQTIYYRLGSHEAREVVALLYRLYCAESAATAECA